LVLPFRSDSASIGVGLGLVGLAFIAFGTSASSRSSEKRRSANPRWVFLAFLGWLLSAASMTGQYIGSVLNPSQPLTQVSVFFFIATIILLPFIIRRGNAWFSKNEFVGGIANGFIQAISIFITLEALQRMGAEIVFPVTVLGPIIAVLLLSAFVYKEKLNRWTWMACLSGTIGLAMLALSR
jgi:drug/metabolite transporter (DMT)-like permease